MFSFGDGFVILGKMEKIRAAIIRTLAYADVFDFPLTAEEIWRFLISPSKARTSDIQRALTRTRADSESLGQDDGFYFLKGRKKTVLLRKRRERWSRKKIKEAHRVARWLRLIPWVKMVAVTGSLAMKNAEKDEDIDLLVVSSRNRLWLTRALVTILTELVANRRHVGDKKFRDKVCLNMFLDEGYLKIPENEQDLYSAHEVCQLLPILDKDNTYKRFISANLWVKKYLANALSAGKYWDTEGKKKSRNFLNIPEFLAFRLQLWYMRSRRTREIVEPHRIRFHPHDCRGWILKKYQRKLEELVAKKIK